VKVDAKVFTIDQIDARIGELEALLAAGDPDWQPPQTLGQAVTSESIDTTNAEPVGAVDQFRRTWNTAGPLADLPRFVADALELAVQLLDGDTEPVARAVEAYLEAGW
jgi:hypothetical protein